MGRLCWRDVTSRPAFSPAVAYGLGIWVGGRSAGIDPTQVLAVAAALGLLGAAFARRVGAFLCILFSWFAAGVGLANLEARVRMPLGFADNHPLRIEGEVESVTLLEDATRFEVNVARVLDLPAPQARFRALVNAKGPLELFPGQRVLLPVALRLEPPVANPGQWDASESRRRRALLFTGSVDSRRIVVLSPPPRWRVWLRSTQKELSARVRSLAPTSEAASLYLTLAAGLRAELGPELEMQFAKSGLAHVLSVSGLHVAVLAVLALRMTRWVLVRSWPGARSSDARRWAGILGVPIIWAYVVFTGNQPPAVRSAVMASAVMLGMSLWRRADPLNSLAIASILLLTVDPSGIADLSLQLSFLAVLSLILLVAPIREALPISPPSPTTQGRWKQRLRQHGEEAVQVFCASVAVTTAALPLIAATFHRVSFAGLVSNIVCLPLCGILTALAAGGAAMFVVAPWASTPVLLAGSWASHLLLRLAQLFAALPGASRPVPGLGAWQTGVFFAGLVAFGVGSGRWRRLGFAVPAVLLSLFLPIPWETDSGLTVTFLSVGHGDAIVLSSAGKHALVDGGGVPGGTDTGRKYVLPFLREKRVHELELAVLSHPHPDHALGLVSTLAEVPARRLWIPAETGGELTRQVIGAWGGAKAEEVQRGAPPLQLGEATIEVLGPPVDKILLKGINDRSVVLKVRHQKVTFLLTGDIERAGEEVLEVGQTTVLKAPHHGSNTSSSESLLRQTQPRYVVFCVGLDNRFHFPNPVVESRYQAMGAQCFRTDRDGAVTFESNGNDVRWRTFLPPASQTDIIGR